MAGVSRNFVEFPDPAVETTSADILLREFKTNFKQISRQSAIFLAGTFFTLAVGYFLKIFVARVLGAQALGIYALGMTVVSFAQLWGALGLPATAARYVAAYNGSARYDALRGLLARATAIIVILNLLFAAGMIFAARAAAAFYHAPQLAAVMPWFAVLMFLGAIVNFYSQVVAGFKDVARRTIIVNFIGTPLGVVLTVVLLELGTGLWGYLAAQIINTLMICVLLIQLLWKLLPPATRVSSMTIPRLERSVISFAAASLGMTIVDFLGSQADKILLGYFLDPKLLGIYVLASTLVAFVPILLQSVNQIFAPVIADLHAQGQFVVLGKLYRVLTKWIMAGTIPVSLVLIVFARPMMRIFGGEFALGWPVLVIGTLGQLVNCAVGSVGYLLLMSGHQKRLLKVQIASAIVSVIANLLLIPSWGIVGAAAASALINAGGNLWNVVEVRKALRLSPFNPGYFALLLPTSASIAVLLLLRRFAAPSSLWLLILCATVLSYAVFAAASLPISDADDRLIAGSAWLQLRGGLRRAFARS
jgi:O-antigen/teichoic acid export membrane protein